MTLSIMLDYWDIFLHQNLLITTENQICIKDFTPKIMESAVSQKLALPKGVQGGPDLAFF